MSDYPTQVVWHQASGALELAWADGMHVRLDGRRLRLSCRCAGCERMRRSGSEIDAPAAVKVIELHPMGDGAVQIRFSDGHDRGIYPWSYLRDIAVPSDVVA